MSYLSTRRSIAPVGDLIFALLGQSNATGKCIASADYTFSAKKTHYTALDGFTRPLIVRAGDGANAASPIIVYATPTGPNLSAAFAQRMRELGETRSMLFVPCAHDSTSSGAWANDLTTSPPIINSVIGNSKHRIRHALRKPGSKLFVLIDQGEANADSAGEAAAWDPDWNGICDELNTYFVGRFDKDTHFAAVRLALNVAGVGGFAANVRAAQDAWVAARSDAILVQGVDPTCEGVPGLHRTGSEQQAQGIALANAVFSSS